MNAVGLMTVAVVRNPGDVAAQAAFTDAVTEAAQEASQPAAGFCGYHPEMGESRPVAQLEMSIGHYGDYYISTPITLKGRGITFLDVHTDPRRNGWNRYRVTDRAYAKLETQYRIASEMLL